MRRTLAFVILALAILWTDVPDARAQDGPAWALVIHGGAGTIRRENMSAEHETAIRGKLTEALETGRAVLEAGGSAVEAVEATIVVMEDSPLFNAGKGAVFTHEGANELDASIMNGEDLNAGAVAGVKHVRNPIRLARAVMEDSEHVMFAREGAEEFALQQGFDLVPVEYFYTPGRWRSLQRVLEREAERTSARPFDEKPVLDGGNPRAFASRCIPVRGVAPRRHGAAMPPRCAWRSGRIDPLGANADIPHRVLGTVGVVALDAAGHLAAGTSTGGMTNKRFGRVGDSPVIAAGTYADDAACAVSATGHGEWFIRNAVAHDICARVAYAGMSIREAAEGVIMDKLVRQGASGGVIALGPDGSFATPFNTAGMYRGWVTPDTAPTTAIYDDEPR